jgi:hypothetical protein
MCYKSELTSDFTIWERNLKGKGRWGWVCVCVRERERDGGGGSWRESDPIHNDISKPQIFHPEWALLGLLQVACEFNENFHVILLQYLITVMYKSIMQPNVQATMFPSTQILTRDILPMFQNCTFAHYAVYSVCVFQGAEEHFLLVEQSCWSMRNLWGCHKPWASKEAHAPKM